MKADRLQSFAEGDLVSEFPECNTEDEIAYMIRVAKGMADNLNLIITDAGELLGQMADGNYAIGTKIEEKYIGQFGALINVMRKMNRQMNSTLEQAEVGVNQISEVVQSNSASAEESSATSEELSAQAFSLNDLVGKFILRRN